MMTTILPNRPKRCTICGCYLTLNEEYVGARCLDPGHWQAAGLLTPPDFYTMARIMAAGQAKGLTGSPCADHSP
jgi:hypothetical protein